MSYESREQNFPTTTGPRMQSLHSVGADAGWTNHPKIIGGHFDLPTPLKGSQQKCTPQKKVISKRKQNRRIVSYWPVLSYMSNRCFRLFKTPRTHQTLVWFEVSNCKMYGSNDSHVHRHHNWRHPSKPWSLDRCWISWVHVCCMFFVLGTIKHEIYIYNIVVVITGPVSVTSVMLGTMLFGYLPSPATAWKAHFAQSQDDTFVDFNTIHGQQ